MKTKEGFTLKTICGESIIVPEGKKNIDFTKIISMNESAAYLWKNINDKEFSAQTLSHLLTKEYDIDADTALADANTIINQWKEVGIIEE